MDERSARPGPESLLEHAGWARRLAASLVGETDADDLVQETWRIALERPPRAESAAGVRAWLGRVLASLGTQARAKRSTRAWHEERAAKRESVESDTEERAELQRLLANAVYALEEPYRSAIVLRYFDGLDARAIAERQRISHDAARQRVSRGLALLRERLDWELRGGRAAWSAMCVAWVEKSPLPSASGVLATGGSIVATKLAMALGALAVIVALTFWWSGSRHDAAMPAANADSQRAAVAVEPPESSRGAGAALPSAESERAMLAAAAGSPPRAIDRERDLHGVVVDPDGKPIAGAALVVLRSEFSEVDILDVEHSHSRRSVAEARSDERGEFVFPLPQGRAFELVASASGFATRTLTHVHAGERVLVELAPGAAVFGRVTRRADGSPVAKALVELPFRPRRDLGGARDAPRTLTDFDGRYRFDGLAAGEYWLQVAPEREGTPGWVRIDLAAGEQREQDVAIDAGVTLKGRVLDLESGAPIAGAEIGEGWTFDRRVTSDLDGNFVFEGFSTQGYYSISARAHGYGRREVTVRDPDAPFPESMEIRLQRAHVVRGRIVGVDGAPIEGAYVAATAHAMLLSDPTDAQQLDWKSTRSGADGVFLLEDVRADLAHSLHVRLDGYGAVTYGFPPNEGELADIDLGDVVLRVGGLVKGVLVDEHDAPIADSVVRLEGWNADVERLGARPSWSLASYLRTRSTRTDDLGRFAFADVAAGSYGVFAGREDSHGSVSVGVTVVDGVAAEPVKLVLPTGLAISGVVVDRSGAPVLAYVSVDSLQPDVTTSGDTRTSDDGSFRAGGLAAGKYSITVYPLSLWSDDPDVLRHARTVVGGVDAGTSDVRIVVERAMPLRGRVVDAQGAPAVGMNVVAKGGAGIELGDQAITDPDGRFALWLVEGVRFDLEAFAPLAAGNPGASLFAEAAGARLEGVLAGGDDIELRLR
ncbi:MAG: sigma-70 family RNA polymerase sigma factor [Planctomycetes bacterium]|nr:sigma-70 family RNA polymerase sigma factor [Planctomycetota bacterium]